MRRVLCIVAVVACAGVWAGAATAAPVKSPHATLDNRYTTPRPGAVSGFTFLGRYHAKGDPKGDPPYMRKMIFYQPPGLRYDTSVPARCTASDVELAVRGAAACPAGSRLGGGASSTVFMGSFPSTLKLDFFNNRNEQIILARSPVLASIARGSIRPDGSVVYESPTCFPTVEPAGCPVDDVLQVESRMNVPPYVKRSGGRVRSYMRTPPTCPARGHWRTPVKLWWADGSIDTVVTKQPCRRKS
jgi:hypothetical protein